MPEFLSWPTLRWDKIKSGNLVNINLHNVVESTNQSPGIPPHFIEVQVPWQEPGFKQGYGPPAPENEVFDIDKAYADYEAGPHAAILARIEKENIERVESAPGNIFPFWGSLMRAGRYEFQYGYHAQARGALKDVAVEGALTYAGGKLIGAGIKYAVGATKTSTNVYKHSFKYAGRVRMRGVQDPVSHNFPYSFDDAILSTNPILKNNGYKIFQQSGTMNGKNGVFEIGLTKDGIIDHRFFKPIK